MSVGQTWPAEGKTFTDPRTGVPVRQLTDYKGHSHHFYFTNPGWVKNGQALLFGSDRENRTNLFQVDLGDGTVTQLTDLEPVPLPREVEFLRACVNTVRDEVYYFHEYKLLALDLTTMNERQIAEMPHGFDVSMINCAADGAHVYTGIWEDLSDQFQVDLQRGYIGFRETFEAKPLSRIIKVATDGSGAETVFEEHYWIGHVNTSPTQTHLLTFCHEGPWNLVDNRIWGLNTETGEAWKIRPRRVEGESVGHEYWYADGETVGYHGRTPERGEFIGRVRYDNTDEFETFIEDDRKPRYGAYHIHSNDESLVVDDHGRYVWLWRWNGEGYDPPRALAEHRSSMKIQQLHVHPRLTPDNRQVVFTSDLSGYGNIYVADVPDDLSTLPTAADLGA